MVLKKIKKSESEILEKKEELENVKRGNQNIHNQKGHSNVNTHSPVEIDGNPEYINGLYFRSNQKQTNRFQL